ncbi:MAG: hypothetical protein DRI69_09915 [Bacteroidetes bacterium]|nr:MAG: hypothetical protein DRI69_09915 [Bacteroidota bacterium]
MKIVINLLLVGLICLLGYLLYDNIKEPIEFQKEKTRRERAVVAKLMTIRQTQEFYRTITGSFSNNFDTLAFVLSTEDFMIINVMGDPDDPNFDISQITYDTSYFPAIDSLNAMGIDLDSLRFVPFAPKGTTFKIQADTIEYQKTMVHVVEVGVIRKLFMGEYGDERFKKYDSRYKPNQLLKFGDMNTPNTAGNWER